MKPIRSFAAIAIAVGLLTATSQPAHAGGVFGAKIVEVATVGTQYAYVKFNVNISSRATCSTQLNQMAIDLNTSKGRAALSIATAALLGNLSVGAFGTNATTTASCTGITLTSGGTATQFETLYWLSITP